MNTSFLRYLVGFGFHGKKHVGLKLDWTSYKAKKAHREEMLIKTMHEQGLGA